MPDQRAHRGSGVLARKMFGDPVNQDGDRGGPAEREQTHTKKEERKTILTLTGFRMVGVGTTVRGISLNSSCEPEIRTGDECEGH